MNQRDIDEKAMQLYDSVKMMDPGYALKKRIQQRELQQQAFMQKLKYAGFALFMIAGWFSDWTWWT